MNTIKYYYNTYKIFLLMVIIGALISASICFIVNNKSQSFNTQSLRMNVPEKTATGKRVIPRGSQGSIQKPDSPLPPINQSPEAIERPATEPSISETLPNIIPPNDSEDNQGRQNPRLYKILGLFNNEEIIVHLKSMSCLDNRNSLSSAKYPINVNDAAIINWLGFKASNQSKQCACFHNAIEHKIPTGKGIEQDGAYHIKVDGKRMVLNAETLKQYCMNGLFLKNETSIELFGSCLPSVSHIGYSSVGTSEIIDEIALSDFNSVCSIDSDGGGKPTDPVPEFSCLLNGPDKVYSNQGFPIAIVIPNKKELLNGNFYLELNTLFDQSKGEKVIYPIQLNPVIIQQKQERSGNYIFHVEIKNKINPDKVLAACQKTIIIEQREGDQNPRNESIGVLPKQESIQQQNSDVQVYNPQPEPEQVTIPLPRKLTQ